MVISDKLIERYRVLKAEASGCLLLMQVGAFMQVMDEDARAVSAVTGLELQVGGDVDAPTVAGGFPKSGHRTLIQMESDAMAKMRGSSGATRTGRPGWLTAAALLGATSAVPVWALTLGEGDQFAWSESSGWLNVDSEHSAVQVQVFPDQLEGEVWHENLGWIRLAGKAANGDDFGVAHDGAGHLSGFAWSESAGWINFASDNGGGVTIDLETGVFSGLAWGENVGWIQLSGTALDGSPYGVTLGGEDGVCGAAAGQASLLAPSANLCAVGAAGPVTSTTGGHAWSCAGLAGGAATQCAVPGANPPVGTGTVTFETTEGGCTIVEAALLAPPAGGPRGRTMPYGALSFRLSGCTGTVAELRLSFSGEVGDLEYWKYRDGRWRRMTQGVTLAGNSVRLRIADNGPYDSNPTVGEIDDPSGPVTRAGGGAAPIPAVSGWGLLLGASLLGLLGAWRQGWRRRKG